MGGFMKRTIVASSAILALVVAGCSSSDPTASEEYQALEQELVAAEQQLAETEQALAEAQQDLGADQAEMDILASEERSPSARYEAALATQETMLAIMEDPASFGDEDEVLDLLDSMATPGVVSGDLAWGGTSTGIWRTGWRNTLFGGTDATIRTWKTWLSDDGSVGGSLWTWTGTAQNGKSFSIEGLELSRFNENGLYTEVVMLYPYENNEVHRRFREGN